jgi:hypothetical protein
MPENRTTPRIRLQVPVTLADGLHARSTDISPGGICAEMQTTSFPGARLNGTLHLEDREIPFVGELAWATAAKSGRGCRLGLRFVDFDASLLPMLAR